MVMKSMLSLFIIVGNLKFTFGVSKVFLSHEDPGLIFGRAQINNRSGGSGI
jgi:hypothetical protein